jgi:hypothetical protein
LYITSACGRRPFDEALVLKVAIALCVAADEFAAHLGEEPGAERHSLTLEKCPRAACTRAPSDWQRDASMTVRDRSSSSDSTLCCHFASCSVINTLVYKM